MQQAVTVMTEAYRGARNRYEGGLARYLDVLSAEDQLLASVRQLVDAVARPDARYRSASRTGRRLERVRRRPACGFVKGLEPLSRTESRLAQNRFGARRLPQQAGLECSPVCVTPKNISRFLYD